MLLLLSGVLVTAATLVYLSAGRTEEHLVLGGARLGVENALAGLREKGGEFRVIRGWLEGKRVIFEVAVRGSDLPDSEIKSQLRENALNYIWYTLTGSFPSRPAPVGGYDVEIRIERL